MTGEPLATYWMALARRRAEGKSSRLSSALAALGPSYIKLGQFLATRRDVIGPELAADLANLQDRLPPFPMSEARRMSAAFSDAGENGLHLDNATVDRMAAAQSARAWPARAALWLGACRWQQSQSSSGSLETACSALGR